MSVVFTRVATGYNPETGEQTTVTTTIPGHAIQVRGDPERYRNLGLIESSAPTLLFTADEYGLRSFTDEFVQVGDSVVWNGRTFTVREVLTIAPDGVVIAARIVVAL